MSEQTKEKHPPSIVMIADTDATIDMGGGHKISIKPGDTATISKTFMSQQSKVPSVVFVPQGNKSTFVVPLAMVKKHYRTSHGAEEVDRVRRDHRNDPNPQVTTGGRRTPEEIRARAGRSQETSSDMQSTNEQYSENEMHAINEACETISELFVLEQNEINEIIDQLNLEEALYLDWALDSAQMVFTEENRPHYKSTPPMTDAEFAQFTGKGKKINYTPYSSQVLSPTQKPEDEKTPEEIKFDALLKKAKEKDYDPQRINFPKQQSVDQETLNKRIEKRGKNQVSSTGQLNVKRTNSVENEGKFRLQKQLGLPQRADKPATSPSWRGNFAQRMNMRDVPRDKKTGEPKFDANTGKLTSGETADARAQGKAAAAATEKFKNTRAGLQQILSKLGEQVKYGDELGKRMHVMSRLNRRNYNLRTFGTAVPKKVRAIITKQLADLDAQERQAARSAVDTVRATQQADNTAKAEQNSDEMDKLYDIARKGTRFAKKAKTKSENYEQEGYMIENYVNYASDGDVVNFADTIRERLNLIAHQAIENEKAIQLGYDAVENDADVEGIEESTNELVEHINSLDEEQLNEYFDSLSDEELELMEELLGEAKYGTKKGRHGLAMKIRAGKDIGKKGKNFEKVAEKAAKRYGSAERGRAVAAAAMWKKYGGKK